MNLMSCEHCGVVLDLDHIPIKDKYDDEKNDYTIISENVDWAGYGYQLNFTCPVCKKTTPDPRDL